MMNTEGNNGNKPLGPMERRFHRHWGNGGAGIFALLGRLRC